MGPTPARVKPNRKLANPKPKVAETVLDLLVTATGRRGGDQQATVLSEPESEVLSGPCVDTVGVVCWCCPNTVTGDAQVLHELLYECMSYCTKVWEPILG